MSIFRSDDYSRFPSSYRIDPTSREQSEEEMSEKKRRKVAYQGRSWAETEEDLPVQPPPPQVPEKKSKKSVYADQVLLEKAEKLLARFPTLEEKIGQLCFFVTDAFYDLEVQTDVETLIQVWQIGGLLFTKGEFRRQSYLIERYQELSKTPLLMGNDFLHGLSFYFQGEIPLNTIEKMDERRSSDLGKAVVFQNKRLGVHFQFDRELIQETERGSLSLSDSQARSFRNGIREAQGIVGKEKVRNQKISHSAKLSPKTAFLAPITASDQIQEAFGLRTINFMDFTHIDESEDIEQRITESLLHPSDAFLIRNRKEEILKEITKAVMLGKIKESDIDRRLIKVLLLKLTIFNLN